MESSGIVVDLVQFVYQIFGKANRVRRLGVIDEIYHLTKNQIARDKPRKPTM